MNSTALNSGPPKEAVSDFDPVFYWPDTPYERISSALAALNAVSCLIGQDVPGHYFSHVKTDDLGCLLDMIGREIDEANHMQRLELLKLEENHHGQ